MSQKKRHINDEREVHCPIDGCDATPLARGVHLHVMRSKGNGHGEQGEIPDDVSFENLEESGTREVSMDYPERRETEDVARLCPYCEQPFRGKQGVLIHLGQVAGKRDHPEALPDDLDPNDFPIAHVDKHDNVVEVVEEGDTRQMPSSTRDADQEVLPDRVEEYLEKLREEGRENEAAEAEEMLLGDD